MSMSMCILSRNLIRSNNKISCLTLCISKSDQLIKIIGRDEVFAYCV
jgi:hypothetical protein